MARRIVVVGGGFAGYHAAKKLVRLREQHDAQIVLLNPTDYFLYLPLLPEVGAGVLDPRRICVSLPGTLPGVRLALGAARSVSLESHEVAYDDAEGRPRTLEYDRLVLATGSVNKLLPVPGIATHAHGFRSLPEAMYLRDHVVRQIELAAAAEDPDERTARCTFVVVGAGYTGTEIAAQGVAMTRTLAARHPELTGQPIRWMLLDVASSVLPGLDPRLARTADRVLRGHHVEVRTGTSVHEATEQGVVLDTGEQVPTRTIVWSVGVRADPLIDAIGLPTREGRIVVDDRLTVPGHPEVFACGDAAAVPDATRPGEVTPMTAQHAQRQGTLAGANVAASLGSWTESGYLHRNLGFVVDLGAHHAAANPLGLRLSGLPAKIVTRGYHLAALPANRAHVAVDWTLDAVLRHYNSRHNVELGMIRAGAVPLDTSAPELPSQPG